MPGAVLWSSPSLSISERGKIRPPDTAPTGVYTGEQRIIVCDFQRATKYPLVRTDKILERHCDTPRRKRLLKERGSITCRTDKLLMISVTAAIAPIQRMDTELAVGMVKLIELFPA